MSKESKSTYWVDVGGNIPYTSKKGESCTRFVTRILGDIGHWKRDTYTDTIHLMMDKAHINKLGALDDDVKYCSSYYKFSDSGLRDTLQLYLQQLRPIVRPTELLRMINKASETLSVNKSYHSVGILFKNYLQMYDEEHGANEFDTFFDSITFEDDEYERESYKHLFLRFCMGVVHNIFYREVESSLFNRGRSSGFFDKETLEKIRIGCEQPHIPIFNGILVLCGEQGVGKSHMINCLLPEDLRTNVVQGYSLLPKQDTISHTDAEQLDGAILLNLEDINVKQIQAMHTYMKAQLERKYWSYRFLFDNQTRYVHRTFTPVASTNEVRILFDSTGNRRIIPFWINKIEWDAMNGVSRPAMWSYIYREWLKEFHTVTKMALTPTGRKSMEAISERHLGGEIEQFMFSLFGGIRAYEPKDVDIKLSNKVIRHANSIPAALAYFCTRQPYYCLPITLLSKVFGTGEESPIAIGKRLRANDYTMEKRRMGLYANGNSSSRVTSVFVENTSSLTKRLEGYIGKEYRKGPLFSFHSLSLRERVRFVLKMEGLDKSHYQHIEKQIEKNCGGGKPELGTEESQPSPTESYEEEIPF